MKRTAIRTSQTLGTLAKEVVPAAALADTFSKRTSHPVWLIPAPVVLCDTNVWAARLARLTPGRLSQSPDIRQLGELRCAPTCSGSTWTRESWSSWLEMYGQRVLPQRLVDSRTFRPNR